MLKPHLANGHKNSVSLSVNEFGTYSLFGSILLVALTVLSWTDIKSFRLPDKITLPLIGLGIVQAFLLSDIQASLIGAIIGYLAFVLIEQGFRMLRGKEGLGRGDAKLLAAGGAWCGWSGLPLIVLIASGTGLLLALLPKYRDQGRIPFGPCLAFGIFMVWASSAYVRFTVGS